MVSALLADTCYLMDTQTAETHQTLPITHLQQQHLPSPTQPIQQVTNCLLICPQTHHQGTGNPSGQRAQLCNCPQVLSKGSLCHSSRGSLYQKIPKEVEELKAETS